MDQMQNQPLIEEQNHHHGRTTSHQQQQPRQQQQQQQQMIQQHIVSGNDEVIKQQQRYQQQLGQQQKQNSNNVAKMQAQQSDKSSSSDNQEESDSDIKHQDNNNNGNNNNGMTKMQQGTIQQQHNQNRQQNNLQQQQQLKLDDNLFTLPEDLKLQQQKLQYRQRKTRWGERQIKRSKIQQDAIFNPLQALYSGTSLLPITQYGQAQLQIKMQLYSDGRKRKSKWHHQIQKTFTPPMLNYISPNLSLDQVQYILRLYRLDELTSIINDYQPEDTDIRSPSPQPIYDRDGKRINTRQVRKRDQLHRQRISLIQDCMKMRSTFIPPQDYKPLKKFKKIYLTQQAINDSKANYIGKLIGPQGQTQKIIEKRSGCRIAVRGRGANKKQKDIFQNFQPLHIIIVADNDQQLDKGVEEVQKILNGEQDQEIKAMLEGLNSQLMGVFNDNYCENCQQQGHRTWACPFGAKSKVQVTCSICGQSSHPTSDCPQKQAYLKNQQTNQIAMLLQSQYDQFRQQLEHKPKGGLAFITDIDRKKLLAIGDGPAVGNVQQQQQGIANNGSQYNNNNNKKRTTMQEQIVNNSLPMFEDD